MSKAVKSNDPSLTISQTDTTELKFDWEADKIVVKTGSETNLLQLARRDPHIKSAYQQLLSKDYIFYMHSLGKSYFIRRALVKTIWKRTDLVQYGDTFYTVTPVAPNKVNQLAPLRLCVIFSSMPGPKEYYSPNVADRMFVQNYPSLAKHLVKNTLILRIMDLNRNFGTYYMNTENYPTFEEDVQGIIRQVMADHDIDADDVVLYGGSKGGSGALYHSILGNYHAVVVDPIFSQTNYWQGDHDVHFTQGYLPEKLLATYQAAFVAHPNTREKTIIGTPQVRVNYDEYLKLDSPLVHIYHVFDDHIQKHPDVSANSTIEQVTLMNQYLLSSPNLLKLQAAEDQRFMK
ncbi:XcbB/CpsF family capsular polysaccharide biosynthesis protein [Lacticaseibacillus mingshuiensis]|uniref:XcbB/CpsF family capsular polysaccharide biosynthesis protein n=1 Tax=Lacticaseibacillus mingshuiensis TaxID=2799574 RepID=UPI00194DC176|nr:XcbB/CpsF family capsular polysaccharide biosynthesis protein [Lacticaseibacillus mingshuiensis]